MMRTTAFVTSGPIPSPGIRVMVCCLGIVGLSFCAMEVDPAPLLAFLWPAWCGLPMCGFPMRRLPVCRIRGPALRGLVLGDEQSLQLFLEFAHVGEVTVDAGDADGGPGGGGSESA